MVALRCFTYGITERFRDPLLTIASRSPDSLRSRTRLHTSSTTPIPCTTLDRSFPACYAADERGSNESYGWHLQYLTIIGLSLASLTFILALLADITLSPRLFAVKNSLSVGSAPMEVLISVLYWTIHFVSSILLLDSRPPLTTSQIDPSLLIPPSQPPRPFLADLSIHLLPAVLLTTDLLFFSPPYGIGLYSSMALSAGIATSYWAWIERCFAANGFYPYPLFELLSFPQRVGLFAVSALLMSASTGVLVWVYAMVNGVEVPSYGNYPRPTDRRKKTT